MKYLIIMVLLISSISGCGNEDSTDVKNLPQKEKKVEPKHKPIQGLTAPTMPVERK